MTSLLARFRRHQGDFEALRGYLDTLAKAKGITPLQRHRKGSLKALTINQYVVLRDFIYKVSVPYRPYVELQSVQFELHELLWSFMDYQATREAIEDGTGVEAIDRIFSELLASQPLRFFTAGYYKL